MNSDDQVSDQGTPHTQVTKLLVHKAIEVCLGVFWLKLTWADRERSTEAERPSGDTHRASSRSRQPGISVELLAAFHCRTYRHPTGRDTPSH